MATIIGWTAVERELRRRRPGWTIETAFWIDAGAVPVLHCHVVRRCGSKDGCATFRIFDMDKRGARAARGQLPCVFCQENN